MGHIVVLLHRVKDRAKRDWYVEQTIIHGWSRAVLEIQIDTDVYGRQAIASAKTANFDKNLPVTQFKLALEILKDPYNFDFLTIGKESNERDIEHALIKHVRDFLLELGSGFAYIGSQVPLNIDDQEFFIDLLFYHIELKSTKFKPEHTGQLGFYLAVVEKVFI